METLKTPGQIFPDGQAIEIVRQAGDHTRNLALLHWNGQQSRIANNLELSGKIYEPVEISPGLLRAVRLATESRTFGSLAVLVKSLATAISKYTGLVDHVARLAAFFSIATWLFDRVGTAPRLIVYGPQGRASDQLMKILSCLCRHAISLGDTAPSGLLSLPFPFGFTLLIRPRKMTERLRQFLFASRMENQFVFHGDVLWMLFVRWCCKSKKRLLTRR